MNQVSCTVFETAVGWVGIAWNDRGVTAMQLPDRDRASTERRLIHKSDGVPVQRFPAFVKDAIRRITRHLEGKSADLKKIPLDLDGVTPFRKRVYDEARRIPAGETRTYGELAAAAGSPGAARAVGSAMANNPVAILVPCHRVLGSNGIGGFSSPGGLETKRKLLAVEKA